MGWKTLFQNEHMSLVLDTNHNHCMMEVSSGGYQPRYVTLHLNGEDLSQLIDELQKAKEQLINLSDSTSEKD